MSAQRPQIACKQARRARITFGTLFFQQHLSPQPRVTLWCNWQGYKPSYMLTVHATLVFQSPSRQLFRHTYACTSAHNQILGPCLLNKSCSLGYTQQLLFNSQHPIASSWAGVLVRMHQTQLQTSMARSPTGYVEYRRWSVLDIFSLNMCPSVPI